MGAILIRLYRGTIRQKKEKVSQSLCNMDEADVLIMNCFLLEAGSFVSSITARAIISMTV